MHLTHALSKRVLAFITSVVLAVQVGAAPVSAAPSTAAGLDEQTSRLLETTAETQRIPVIIEGSFKSGTAQSNARGRSERAEASVRSKGGQVVGSAPLIGATVAELTPAEIRALTSDPSIGRIHFDSPVKSAAAGGTDSASSATPIVFQQTVGATQAWANGNTGRGVTVAVLDTGIDNNNAAFGARVKARVDLVDPAHPAQGDPAGHGTHVAGIIAASRMSASPGVAPDASLVSVRVLDDQGRGRLSTVIHGLEWSIVHREEYGIRVIVLALGAPAVGSYREDPLAAMTEMAWHSGIVVLAAAGNGGPGAGTVQTPGIDPLIITVGATDEQGTATVTDDTVPFFSAQGPTADRAEKPDLVAPGRKIVSVRVPGSTLDRLLPTHIEGPTTFRLTGTSESVAVAGGSVALVLAERSRLTPDQVKATVTRSANQLAGVARSAQGSGEISVTRALAARTPSDARQKVRPSDALLRMLPVDLLKALLGDIGRGRGGDDNNTDDGAQVNPDRLNWDRLNWDRLNWDQLNWDQLNWDRLNWDRLNWDQLNWDRLNWDQLNWDRLNWDRLNWDQLNWDRLNWDQLNWDAARLD